MNTLTTAIAAGLLAITLAVGSESPEIPQPLTIEEVVVSPTSLTWGCGQCIECSGDRVDVSDDPQNAEYSNAVCQLGPCNFPICLNEEDEEEQEVAMTHEDMVEVSDWILSAAPEAALTALAKFPTKVQFVEARRSVQLLSCEGNIVANLPLSDAQFEAVLAEQQQ